MKKEIDPLSQPLFFIQSDGKGKFINIKKEAIVYIEGNSNYLYIHLKDASHQAYLTLIEIEAILPGHQFIRIHKSFIVNVDHIVCIDGYKVQLSTSTCIILGRSYRKKFFDQIGVLLLKSKR